MPEDQKGLKGQVFQEAKKRACRPSIAYKSAKVKEGGKIIIYSGDEDDMTRSREVFNKNNSEIAANSQMTILTIKDGYHMTPWVKPKETIQLVYGVLTPSAVLSTVKS